MNDKVHSELATLVEKLDERGPMNMAISHSTGLMLIVLYWLNSDKDMVRTVTEVNYCHNRCVRKVKLRAPYQLTV